MNKKVAEAAKAAAVAAPSSEEQVLDIVLPTLLALDDGSGNMEARFIDDENSLIEEKRSSFVVRKPLPSTTSAISEQCWSTVDRGGREEPFTVVDNSADTEGTCSKDYQLSAVNRVLVNNTITQLGLSERPVYLGVTLPTAQFYNRGSDSLINEQRIQDKIDNLLTPVSNVSGAYSAPDIKGVRVYPEAIPAYVYCSALEDGSPNPDYPDEHTTLIVDLGRYTCDLAIISTGYNVVGYQTTENGVQVMIDKLKVLLTNHADELKLHDISGFGDKWFDNLVNRGYIGSAVETEKAIAGRKDVSHLVQEAKEFLNELILRDALALCGNDFAMLDRIVFVGGGANWLKELVEEWYDVVDVPEQPEMAIVRGVHMMLEDARDDILLELGIEIDVLEQPAEEVIADNVEA